MDMTAGPFEWGPTIAGEGVRSVHTLPSIPSFKSMTETLDTKKGKEQVQSAIPESQRIGETYHAEQLLLKQYWEEYCTSSNLQLHASFCEGRLAHLSSCCSNFFQDLKKRMEEHQSAGNSILAGSKVSCSPKLCDSIRAGRRSRCCFCFG